MVSGRIRKWGRRAAGLALIVAGCAPSRDKALVVQPPFAEARIYDNSLYVRLTPGTPLREVVLLSVDPLRGGMTLEEARALAGEPRATRRDAMGTHYSYGVERLGVELAHHQDQDSGPVDKWVVTAAPNDNTLAALLSSDLQGLLATVGGVEELTIHEQRRAALQAFTAYIQGDRLVRLQWYSIEGIPGG